jgi:hypothetical protein
VVVEENVLEELVAVAGAATTVDEEVERAGVQAAAPEVGWAGARVVAREVHEGVRTVV